MPRYDYGVEPTSGYVHTDEISSSDSLRPVEDEAFSYIMKEQPSILNVDLEAIPEASRHAMLNFLLALTENDVDEKSMRYYVTNGDSMADRLEMTNKRGRTFNILMANFIAVLGLKQPDDDGRTKYIPRPYENGKGVNIDCAHEFRKLLNSFEIWGRRPKIDKVVVRIPKKLDIHPQTQIKPSKDIVIHPNGKVREAPFNIWQTLGE